MPDISLLQREYEVVQEESRLPGIVFTVSLSVLLVFVGAYVGLYFYDSFLTGEIQSIEKKMEELKVGESFKNIDKLNALGAKIKMLKSLRESHTSVTKTLAKVEGATHPQASFTTGSFDLAAGTVKLKGAVPGSAIFLRQIELYQADKNISDFEAGNPLYGEKHSVGFDVGLKLR